MNYLLPVIIPDLIKNSSSLGKILSISLQRREDENPVIRGYNTCSVSIPVGLQKFCGR